VHRHHLTINGCCRVGGLRRCAGWRPVLTATAEWIEDAPRWVLTAFGLRTDPLSKTVTVPHPTTVMRLLNGDALDAAVCVFSLLGVGRAGTLSRPTKGSRLEAVRAPEALEATTWSTWNLSPRSATSLPLTGTASQGARGPARPDGTVGQLAYSVTQFVVIPVS
jgi:hypothetical protein